MHIDRMLNAKYCTWYILIKILLFWTQVNGTTEKTGVQQHGLRGSVDQEHVHVPKGIALFRGADSKTDQDSDELSVNCKFC